MQGPRDGTQTLPLLGHQHERRTFFGRQLFVVRAHRNTFKRRGVALDSRLRQAFIIGPWMPRKESRHARTSKYEYY
ncbi:MAG: hypothetical protein KBD78_13750 [Oligoflexales bacterium]|nr:hypothetical protein [Oligoflexales bacterium]